MIAGELYSSNDPELLKMRERAEDLCMEFNKTSTRDPKRGEILAKLMPNSSCDVFLRGPIQFDYGFLTTMGEGTYANYNLIVLDVCPVTIGKNVFMASNVSLLTAMHPLVAEERVSFDDPKLGWTDLEYAKPIVIEDNVWIGGSVTVLGGVKIGKDSVIGAGSVVTRDIPSGVIAYGNPCKVHRQITEKDRVKYHPELLGKEE